MLRRAMMLVLILLLQAPGVVASAPFGAATNGLSCRVTLLPDTLLEGAYLKLAVEFVYQPPSPGSTIQMLSREYIDRCYVVHLRHRTLGKRHERRIQRFGPPGGFGNCGEYDFDPLTQALNRDTFTVALLNPGGDVVVPGDYDVWVTYVNDGRSSFPEHLKAEYGEVF
jgi:hypothetical protein